MRAFDAIGAVIAEGASTHPEANYWLELKSRRRSFYRRLPSSGGKF